MTVRTRYAFINLCWSIGLLAMVPPMTACAQLKMVSIGSIPAQREPQFQVINATLANPEDWPSTFVFKLPDGWCTSTAVGPKVILTAAHCLASSLTASVYNDQIEEAIVTCTLYPTYQTDSPAPDSTADFAICFLKSETLRAPPGGFERIEVDDSSQPNLRESVTLLGFGCTSASQSSKAAGKLYVGSASVVALARDNYYIQTYGDIADTGTGAVLCFGDSGGAAYYSPRGVAGSRRIFAVNSKGDRGHNSFVSVTAKFLPGHTNNPFKDWAISWISDRRTEFCGGAGADPGCQVSVCGVNTVNSDSFCRQ